MTQTSYPFDSQTVSEDQWSSMAKLWRPSGVETLHAGAGSLTVTPGTGLTVEVAAGAATARGHYYASDATTILSPAANTSGNPRKDRIALRLDPIADSIVLAIVEGTPSGTPTPPNLTKTNTGVYEVGLAVVTVADGAGDFNPGDVIDGRERPADPSAPAGLITAYGGTSAPDGWLLCDGADLTADTFPALFAAIGYTYGGSGATFKAPNLTGRAPFGVHAGSVEFPALGTTGGVKARTLNVSDLPAHTHGMDHTHEHSHFHSMAHTHSGATSSVGNHSHTGGTTEGFIQSGTGPAPAGELLGLGPTAPAGAHAHTFTTGEPSATNTGTPNWPWVGPPLVQGQIEDTMPYTDPTGSGVAVPILNPYLTVTYLVKAW